MGSLLNPDFGSLMCVHILETHTYLRTCLHTYIHVYVSHIPVYAVKAQCYLQCR